MTLHPQAEEFIKKMFYENKELNTSAPYIMGIDASTNMVGISLFDANGILKILTYINPNDGVKKDDYDADILNNKADYIAKKVNEICKTYKVNSIFIEEPIFASNNQKTVVKLITYNAYLRLMIKLLTTITPQLVTVHESRRFFFPELVTSKNTLSFPKEWRTKKKEFIHNKVSTKEPQIIWEYKRTGKLKDYCLDMSDAYVVGYYGHLAYLMSGNDGCEGDNNNNQFGALN